MNQGVPREGGEELPKGVNCPTETKKKMLGDFADFGFQIFKIFIVFITVLTIGNIIMVLYCVLSIGNIFIVFITVFFLCSTIIPMDPITV